MTKRVAQGTAVRGQLLRYSITVTNRGPDPAANVQVTDKSRLPLAVHSIHSAGGACHPRDRFSCSLGTLPVGKRVTIMIVAAARVAGREINAVAATSSSRQPDPHANFATTRTTILAARRPPPRVTG